MITRAQLDAALADLERRIERSIDLKLSALRGEIRTEIGAEKYAGEERRSREEEDIFLEMQEALERTDQACQTNAAALGEIRARLDRLEERNRPAGKKEEPPEIADDFAAG